MGSLPKKRKRLLNENGLRGTGLLCYAMRDLYIYIYNIFFQKIIAIATKLRKTIPNHEKYKQIIKFLLKIKGATI